MPLSDHDIRRIVEVGRLYIPDENDVTKYGQCPKPFTIHKTEQPELWQLSEEQKKFLRDQGYDLT